MTKVTVRFSADNVRTEDDARALVQRVSRDAAQVGVRDLEYVSLTQPVVFNTQADLDEYVRVRGGTPAA